MVKCVISDLGRVILFFDNHIFFRKIAEHSPFSAEEIAGMVHDYYEFIVDYDSGRISSQEFYSRVVQILKAEIDDNSFFTIYNDVFTLNPPVLQALTRLRSRYRLVLLSNTDVQRFGFIRRKFPEILIFDAYVLSFEVGAIKPDPIIYQEALNEAGAKAQECLFIDDIPANVEAAENLGMMSILYGPETELEDELRRKGVEIP